MKEGHLTWLVIQQTHDLVPFQTGSTQQDNWSVLRGCSDFQVSWGTRVECTPVWPPKYLLDSMPVVVQMSLCNVSVHFTVEEPLFVMKITKCPICHHDYIVWMCVTVNNHRELTEWREEGRLTKVYIRPLCKNNWYMCIEPMCCWGKWM